MDIEFIEIEHRENVMKLMEICGLDMKEAYELYVDCGYNFEVRLLPLRRQSIATSILPLPCLLLTRPTSSSMPQSSLIWPSSIPYPFCRISFRKTTTSNIQNTKSSSQKELPSTRSTPFASMKASLRVFVSLRVCSAEIFQESGRGSLQASAGEVCGKASEPQEHHRQLERGLGMVLEGAVPFVGDGSRFFG